MDNKRSVITKKRKLDKEKIERAKGLNKNDQTNISIKQEFKIKASKNSIQEFDEWE